MTARILCVEDNVPNMQLMSYLLRAYGHTPIEATDGEAGLTKALSERPDLILMDLQLPKLSGEEVMRRLREDPQFSQTPIVAVTAFAMVGDREAVLGGGFDGYISKPIEPESFVGQVELYLPREKAGTSPILDAPGPSGAVEGPDRARRGTVLYVDDVQYNIDLMHGTLDPFGFEVVGVQTLADGLAAARTRSPDLILCDVHIPGGGGLDMLAALSKDPELSKIPVGIITWTATDAHWERRSLDQGATFFVKRPVEPERLVEIVGQTIARARP